MHQGWASTIAALAFASGMLVPYAFWTFPPGGEDAKPRTLLLVPLPPRRSRTAEAFMVVGLVLTMGLAFFAATATTRHGVDRPGAYLAFMLVVLVAGVGGAVTGCLLKEALEKR